MSPSPNTQPRPGLRERKKAKTRAAIQQHALRLFRAQGYDATTVEQVAEAAEVSPSTFFRYFPTKEDVVLHDRYDPLFVAAFLRQPPELTPLQALRAALREVFASIPADELADERQRAQLILTVPELRARALDQLGAGVGMLADAIAERTGHEPGDFAVRNLAGTLVGVAVATMLAAADDPGADFVELFDKSMAHLEAGLPLDT